jgi:hypothetical protein
LGRITVTYDRILGLDIRVRAQDHIDV